MATVEEICGQWQDVRNGLIKEVELIPEEHLQFRATPATRSVIEILHHIIESERVLAGEVCRDNTNFKRGFPAMIAEFAGDVKQAATKEDVVALLKSSLTESLDKARSFGDASLGAIMTRFDGREQPKYLMLSFSISHEMYHRGQMTVYQRLLGIEPALTQVFKKLTSTSQ